LPVTTTGKKLFSPQSKNGFSGLRPEKPFLFVVKTLKDDSENPSFKILPELLSGSYLFSKLCLKTSIKDILTA